jgi:hypothetical protein
VNVTRTALAVLALAILPYLPSLGGDFVYDDVGLIPEDARVTNHAFLESLRTPYWGERHGGLYRPVTTLSYVVNGLGGTSPLPFRVVNLALHAAASVLALALARRILKSERAAFVAAGLFAVHPLHVEVAANVVGRAESLGFLLAGGAWWLAVPAARDRDLKGLACATVLGTLALLAKENALGVLLAAPLEVLLLSRADPAAVAASAAPAVLSLGVALGARVLALGPDALTPGSRGISWVMNPLAPEPLVTRLANAPYLLLVYAKHFVFPIDLAPDYGGKFLPLATSWRDSRVVLWALGAVALLGGPILASRRRARELAFANGAALLALAPVLQIVPIGTLLGDRLAYAASFGWALVVGVAGEALIERARDARVGRLVVALVLGAFAVVASLDASAWRDTVELFQRARPRVRGSLQVPLVLASLSIEAERYSDALDPLHEAVDLKPDEAGALLLLGKAERLTGRFRLARQHLEKGLALPHLVKDEAGFHLELGLVLIAFQDFEGSARELGRACELAPDAEKLANLGLVLSKVPGRDKDALRALEQSLALDPHQTKADELRKLIDEVKKRS